MWRSIILFILFCFQCQVLAITEINIVTSSFDPPFGSIADSKGHFYGFEIDLMNAICVRLKAKCNYHAYTFNQILAAILSNQADIALDAITITVERQKDFIFSLPYLLSKAQLLTQYNSTIDHIYQIEHKKIGIEAGTIFKSLAEKISTDIEVVEYEVFADLFTAVANKEVDLILIDAATAEFWVNNNDQLFKLVGHSIAVGQGYGLMANPAKFELIKQIDEVLLGLENDGTYLQIYSRYF